MTQRFQDLYTSVLRSLIKMKSVRSLAVSSLLICALIVPAQEASPPGFEQWTGKGLGPSLAELVREAPEDPHHFAVHQLADYANDSYLLVHRAGDGQVEWHETQADDFLCCPVRQRCYSGARWSMARPWVRTKNGTGRSSAAFAGPSVRATSCAFRPAHRIRCC